MSFLYYFELNFNGSTNYYANVMGLLENIIESKNDNNKKQKTKLI